MRWGMRLAQRIVVDAAELVGDPVLLAGAGQAQPSLAACFATLACGAWSATWHSGSVVSACAAFPQEA